MDTHPLQTLVTARNEEERPASSILLSLSEKIRRGKQGKEEFKVIPKKL